jgi:hypothetical protein
MNRIARLRLGELVAESSVAEHEAEVARLVRAARRVGVDELVCRVADDATAPPIVRARAVGRVAVALAYVPRRPDADATQRRAS